MSHTIFIVISDMICLSTTDTHNDFLTMTASEKLMFLMKTKALQLFVRFSNMRLFGFVCFLFPLVSGKACVL